jgi:prepilin-type N-terminal cleavage/methylation domain-containing protein
MNFMFSPSQRSPRRAFTLIELLIVVAIIAILAAIAVPNFLEAQTRAKVAAVKSDLRTLTTGIESYRIDHGLYPEGTDNPLNYPESIAEILGDLAPGYYAFRTRSPNGAIAGLNGFFTLTTPIAYINGPPPLDPFAKGKGNQLPYCYRPAKDFANGWVLTSVGPDQDLFAPGGVGNTNAANPYSTAADGNSPARIGDINERAVIHGMEGTGSITNDERARMKELLDDLSYDPTNGTRSDGDIYRLGGVPRFAPNP